MPHLVSRCLVISGWMLHPYFSLKFSKCYFKLIFTLYEINSTSSMIYVLHCFFSSSHFFFKFVLKCGGLFWVHLFFVSLFPVLLLHYVFVCALAAPEVLWDLSSLTRDWTHAMAVKALMPKHRTAWELPVLWLTPLSSLAHSRKLGFIIILQ